MRRDPARVSPQDPVGGPNTVAISPLVGLTATSEVRVAAAHERQLMAGRISSNRLRRDPAQVSPEDPVGGPNTAAISAVCVGA